MARQKKAAFFDFDETLIDGTIEWEFFWHLVRAGKINLFKSTLRTLALMMLKLRFGRSLLRQYKPYFFGLKKQDLKALMPSFYRLRIRHMIKKDILDRMLSLKEKGYIIVLVTSSLDFMLEPFMREYGIKHAECCIYKEAENLFSKSITNNVPYGKNKEVFVRGFAKLENISLKSSYAFGNLPMDRHMLNAVGNGVSVRR